MRPWLQSFSRRESHPIELTRGGPAREVHDSGSPRTALLHCARNRNALGVTQALTRVDGVVLEAAPRSISSRGALNRHRAASSLPVLGGPHQTHLERAARGGQAQRRSVTGMGAVRPRERGQMAAGDFTAPSMPSMVEGHADAPGWGRKPRIKRRFSLWGWASATCGRSQR